MLVTRRPRPARASTRTSRPRDPHQAAAEFRVECVPRAASRMDFEQIKREMFGSKIERLFDVSAASRSSV